MTRRGQRLAALLLVAAGQVRTGHAQPVALPGVGPADARHPVDVAQPPWRGLARVQGEGMRCTGILVAPRRVLTAAHCLWSVRLGGVLPAHLVHVLLRYDRGGWAGEAVATALRLAPGSFPARGVPAAGDDWAVIELAAPLGGPDDVMRLAETPPAPGTPAMLGGYGQDRAELAEADTRCTVTGREPRGDGGWVVQHDCNGTRGTSGGPILARDPAGVWRVAGLQSRAVLGRALGLAVMPPPAAR